MKRLSCEVDTAPRLKSGVIERQCGRCKEMKPLKAFNYNNVPLHNDCKACGFDGSQ